MNNNQEFEDFWKNFQWPEPAEITYRLYYNDDGKPLFYSMEDMPGKYIEITAEQYQKSNSHVVVRNNRLIELSFSVTQKLAPADTGVPCSPNNVAVVVDQTEPNKKWKLTTYEHS